MRALEDQLAVVEAKITELEAELKHGDVAALARELRRQEAQQRDLTEKLKAARLKAAHPLDESWRECQSLAETLDTAPDPEDARLRLKSALRRIVESIHMLVVPRGYERLCAVQIWFTDGMKHRDYLILHRPPSGNHKVRHEGGWWVRSLSSIAKPGDLDLRRRADASKLEKVLGTTNVAAREPGSE
jgi:hypothetical protein